MILNIEPTINLTIKSILKQKNIPCIFQATTNKFEFHFYPPSHELIASVSDFSLDQISERCFGNVGGKFLYRFHSQISLKNLNENEFEVIDFLYFDDFYGWTSLIQNGQFVELKRWRNDEEMEWELALFKRAENSKKNKKLRALLKRQEQNLPS